MTVSLPRAMHVIDGRAGYVLEMAAPVDHFRTLDANLFDPLAVTGKPR